jgi:hypothetical protein
MRYEVVSKSYRYGGRENRKTASKGDVISLPTADGDILVERGKLKRAAPESSSSGGVAGGTVKSTASKADATK